MRSRNVSSLLSICALLALCLIGPGPAIAQELNLAGLTELEVPAVDVQRPALIAPAPLDLSGLAALSPPAGAAHGVDLQCLQGLDCECPAGCRCVGACQCPTRRTAADGAPEQKASAPLVLPAARPPAAVSVTTAAAGGFWQQQCTRRGCRLVWIPYR